MNVFLQAFELRRNNASASDVGATTVPTEEEEEVDTTYDYNFVNDKLAVPASWSGSNLTAEAEAVHLFFSLPVDVR